MHLVIRVLGEELLNLEFGGSRPDAEEAEGLVISDLSSIPMAVLEEHEVVEEEDRARGRRAGF